MKTGRRMNRSRSLRTSLIFCAVLFSLGTARAEDVTMRLDDQGHGRYSLEGHITVKASAYQIWKVLTDYENIAHFVTSLRKSEIKDSSTERVLLEQQALGRKFFITRQIHVLLQVTEFPYKRIEFEDILKKDFASYKGSWEVRPAEEGLDVVYRLDCERLFVIPNFVAKDALKKSATELLKDVQHEIERRVKGTHS